MFFHRWLILCMKFIRITLDICTLFALRPNLPITEAVIQEILRSACVVPLGILHSCERDVPLMGGKYLLPKGTTVIPNLFHIVNNPEAYPEPDKFNPDRFLDQNGKYVKNEHNIIFSTGN